MWLYPQTDVFIDLADARARDGGVVHFGISDTEVLGRRVGRRPGCVTPRRTARGTRSAPATSSARTALEASCRNVIPPDRRTQYFKEYPFAWFGVMTEAPMSAPELIYAHSDAGFALISQRTPTVQRMYFQCDADESVEAWPEERIWETLQARVAGEDGFRLQEGPIFERTVLQFRSFVQEPMRWGSLLLAGDAAHTVPPTGARGLNLALHDVKVMADVLEPERLAAADDCAARRVPAARPATGVAGAELLVLDDPAAARPTRRERVRHPAPGGRARRRSVGTRAGRRYLAEQYTGWPTRETA